MRSSSTAWYEQPARAALWVTILLIAYGSLYPFRLEVPGGFNWGQFLVSWCVRTSLGDLLGNIGLFMPVGLLSVLAFKRRMGRTYFFGLILLPLAIFALSLQVAQIYVATRVPVLNDVVWNLVGIGVGMVSSVPLARYGAHREARFQTLSVPWVLLCLLVVAELVPLVPTLDVQALKDSLKPLLLGHRFAFTDALSHAAAIMTAGYLFSCVLPRDRARVALGGLAAAVFAGKILVVGQTVDISLIVGLPVGFVAWGWFGGASRIAQQRGVATALLAGYTLDALAPFSITSTANPFGWVPFADLLHGSMLTNVQALLPRLFVFTALVWMMRGRLLRTTVLLSLWAALLEVGQVVVEGRTPAISEPLLVLMIGWILSRFGGNESDGANAGATSTPRPVAAAPRMTGEMPAHRSIAMLRACTGVVAIAIPLWFLIRLPGVPYNVRELLLGNGHFAACMAFGAAILWFGAGAVVMGEQISASARPLLSIPLWGMAVGITSLLMMMMGATCESIGDIAGANNVHYFVTVYGVWGEWGRTLLKALPGPAFVAFFERPVRYASLFGPLFTFLALTHVALVQGRRNWQVPARLVLYAIPWLWFCKGIAFDWSSTDNLNELIARPGAWGLGGGGYLYGVAVLLAVSAATLAHTRGARLGLASAGVVLSLPLAWWLTIQGLEPNVEKYGITFSGLQFLLGPDRAQTLSQPALVARWGVVYLSGTVVLSAGMRLALPFFARRGQGSTRTTSAMPAIQDPVSLPEPARECLAKVRLLKSDLFFLTRLAGESSSDLSGAITSVLDRQLLEQSPDELLAILGHSSLEGRGSVSHHLCEVGIVLSQSQTDRIVEISEQFGISTSRTVRRLVAAFIDSVGEVEQQEPG
jgi:VanZ family protein